MYPLIHPSSPLHITSDNGGAVLIDDEWNNYLVAGIVTNFNSFSERDSSVETTYVQTVTGGDPDCTPAYEVYDGDTGYCFHKVSEWGLTSFIPTQKDADPNFIPIDTTDRTDIWHPIKLSSDEVVNTIKPNTLIVSFERYERGVDKETSGYNIPMDSSS